MFLLLLEKSKLHVFTDYGQIWDQVQNTKNRAYKLGDPVRAPKVGFIPSFFSSSDKMRPCMVGFIPSFFSSSD